MKPISLRIKLTLAFLMIALFSLALVGLFANVFWVGSLKITLSLA